MICRIESFKLTAHFNIDVWGRSEKKANLVARDKELAMSHKLLRGHYENLHFHFLEQVHGSESIFVDRRLPDTHSDIFWGRADAAFSCRKDIALGVRVADCIPIVFSAQDASFFGVIHAGWRGLRSQIITSTIDCVEKTLGHEIKAKIQFWVGPHIGENSYEVREDVFLLFPSSVLKPTSHAQKKYLNLAKILEEQFIKCKINDSQIIWSLQDTYTSNRYYSHRRGDTGRNVIVVYHES